MIRDIIMKRMIDHLIAILFAILAVSVTLGGCAVAADNTQAPVKEENTEDGSEKEGKTPKKEKKEEEQDEPGEFSLYEEMSLWEYHFSSGAGAWDTTVTVSPDGSFRGHYHDSDMGDAGSDYPDGTCYISDFSGKFTGYSETEPYTYKLEIGSLETEREPKTEEIRDGIRYVYAEAFGFDGLADGTSELYVYLPGRSTEGLSDEFWEWIGYGTFATYVGGDLKYIEDVPEDLPFAALYNTDGKAFGSANVSGKNRTYLRNRAKLPDLESTKMEMHDDGTYLYEDAYPGGGLVVTNTCFKLGSYTDPGTDASTYVKECLDKIGIGYNEPPFVHDKQYSSMELDKWAISGRDCVHATWQQGDDKTGTYYRGCFTLPGMYDQTEGESLVYAYIVSSSKDSDKVLGGELASFYLGSLELTGRADEISSAGEHKGIKEKVFTSTKACDDPGYLLSEEVVWVSADDTELIRKYNLDPDEFYDDYQIAGDDGNYTKVPVDDDCIFYVQFPEDGFHKLVTKDEFNKYVRRGDEDSSCLMYLVKDESGKVVIAWEPYTP